MQGLDVCSDGMNACLITKALVSLSTKMAIKTMQSALENEACIVLLSADIETRSN